jgi:hypothetical protein
VYPFNYQPDGKSAMFYVKIIINKRENQPLEKKENTFLKKDGYCSHS